METLGFSWIFPPSDFIHTISIGCAALTWFRIRNNFFPLLQPSSPLWNQMMNSAHFVHAACVIHLSPWLNYILAWSTMDLILTALHPERRWTHGHKMCRVLLDGMHVSGAYSLAGWRNKIYIPQRKHWNKGQAKHFPRDGRQISSPRVFPGLWLFYFVCTHLRAEFSE